jgi:hypothetical protein
MAPLQMAGGASGTEVSVVSGRVVGPDGKAIGAASVSLRTADFLSDSALSKDYVSNHTMLDTLTRADGCFSFSKVLPDTYCIVASYRDSIAVMTALRVYSGVAVYHLPPVTAVPMATIAGNISVASGDSVQGMVQFYGMDFRTKPDSTGHFVIKIPEGGNKVHISASQPDSSPMKPFDGMDISIVVSGGENKNIGSFNLQQQPPSPCMDGNCDSLIVRDVLDVIGQNALDVGSVTTVQNSRIIGLSLRGKTITGNLPIAVLGLTELLSLDLGHTGINALFPEIVSMKQLTVLRLDSNFLTTLPVDIGNLTSLKVLNVAGNDLTSLPASMVTIVPETLLDLSGNRLQQLDTAVAAWADRFDPGWRTTQRTDSPVPAISKTASPR